MGIKSSGFCCDATRLVPLGGGVSGGKAGDRRPVASCRISALLHCYNPGVRLFTTIANRTVMVSISKLCNCRTSWPFETNCYIRSPIIAPAAQQTLIPSSTCFHISYRHERLRAHPIRVG
jgi:hypothetical protein